MRAAAPTSRRRPRGDAHPLDGLPRRSRRRSRVCARVFTSSPNRSSPSTIRDARSDCVAVERTARSRSRGGARAPPSPSRRRRGAGTRPRRRAACFGCGSRRAIAPAPVAGRHVRERRHATGDRAPLRILRALGRHAARVLGDRAEHRPGEPLAGASRVDLADVDGEDRAACRARRARRPRPEPRATGRAGRSTRRRPPRPRPASTSSTARRRPARFASGVPPDTSSSSIISTSSSPSRSQAARIRSACSDGDTNRSPSRSPTRDTRTTPTARRTEALTARGRVDRSGSR